MFIIGEKPLAYDDLNGRKEQVYFEPAGDRLRLCSFAVFAELSQEGKNLVLEKLEGLVKENPQNKLKMKTLNNIKKIRNAVFYLINKGDSFLPKLAAEVLEKIYSYTSPKEMAMMSTFGRSWANGASHKAKILSINRGLSLNDALPPSIKTAQAALEWLKRDEEACKFLTYGNFIGFPDIQNETIKQLIAVCPKLEILGLESAEMTSIEQLPPLLRGLILDECPQLQSLPPLPSTLKRVNIVNSDRIAEHLEQHNDLIVSVLRL